MQAVKILIDQLVVFVGEDIFTTEKPKKEPISICNYLNMTVEELELSGRALNCLKSAGINYVGELVQKTEAELLKIRSFGKKSLDEIVEKLSQYNLSLGMKDIKWKPPKVITE